MDINKLLQVANEKGYSTFEGKIKNGEISLDIFKSETFTSNSIELTIRENGKHDLYLYTNGASGVSRNITEHDLIKKIKKINEI